MFIQMAFIFEKINYIENKNINLLRSVQTLCQLAPVFSGRVVWPGGAKNDYFGFNEKLIDLMRFH